MTVTAQCTTLRYLIVRGKSASGDLDSILYNLLIPLRESLNKTLIFVRKRSATKPDRSYGCRTDERLSRDIQDIRKQKNLNFNAIPRLGSACSTHPA